MFVELKRPGKDLREEQERAAKRLHNLGFECYRACSREDVDALIRLLLNGLERPNIGW